MPRELNNIKSEWAERLGLTNIVKPVMRCAPTEIEYDNPSTAIFSMYLNLDSTYAAIKKCSQREGRRRINTEGWPVEVERDPVMH